MKPRWNGRTVWKTIRNGFTLIELMVVVAILSFIAMIALPKFADMIIRAQEAAILGHLGSLRSAISLYYANNEGIYPRTVAPDSDDMASTLVPTYLDKIPNPSLPAVSNHNNPGHPPHPPDGTAYLWDLSNSGTWTEGDPLDWAGEFHWYYFSTGPKAGQLGVMCEHLTSRGHVWSTY